MTLSMFWMYGPQHMYINMRGGIGPSSEMAGKPTPKSSDATTARVVPIIKVVSIIVESARRPADKTHVRIMDAAVLKQPSWGLLSPKRG